MSTESKLIFTRCPEAARGSAQPLERTERIQPFHRRPVIVVGNRDPLHRMWLTGSTFD
jgi:hypothetical protein